MNVFENQPSLKTSLLYNEGLQFPIRLSVCYHFAAHKSLDGTSVPFMT